MNWVQQYAGTGDWHLESSVIYGNGTFVVNITDGLLSSSDGANWIHHPLPTTNYVGHVTFANGLFFAFATINLGQDNVATGIFSSPDGITWPDHPTSVLPGGVNNNVVFGNGTFVAVSRAYLPVPGGDSAWTSPNGVDWTRQNTGSTSFLTDIAFGSGKFVAVGYSTNNNYRILVSPDGISWMEQTSAEATPLERVTFAGGSFFAWNSYSTFTLTSADGLLWNEETALTPTDLAFGNGQFVAVGNSPVDVLVSDDGTTWRPAQEQPNQGSADLQSVAYGNGTFVVAGGEYVSEPKTRASQTSVFLSSKDGIRWTTQYESTRRVDQIGDFFDFHPLTRVFFGNGIFVAFGDTILTSVDGLAWTPQTNWCCIERMAYGNGVFVGLSDDHGYGVLVSSDGKNWTWQPEDLTRPFYTFTSIAFGNGIFVAVSDYDDPSSIWTSTNGDAWTRSNSAAEFSGQGQLTLFFGNNSFVLAGSGSVATSPDGVSWRTREFSGPDYLSMDGASYANGTIVTVGGGGMMGPSFVATSSDGVVWTPRFTIPASLYLRDVAFGSGTFVAAGSAGTILQSDKIGPRLVSRGPSGSGDFRFDLLGEVGHSYQIEASTNLVNWYPLSQLASTNEVMPVTDRAPLPSSERFYRAVSP